MENQEQDHVLRTLCQEPEVGADQQADTPAPLIEKVPNAKPAVQRQPVAPPKEKQEIEAELETNAA